MDVARFVFAGGGTGGHLFPGLAVADAMRELYPDARVTFLTTMRRLDRDLLAATPYAQLEQSVRPLVMRPWTWPAFYLHWHRSVARARQLFLREPPTAVLGLGGYAAGPAVVAATRLGIRTAILNPDAVPGRANRYLAKLADLVVLQWEVTRAHFDGTVRCETLGCPIRSAFRTAAPGEGRARFGLHPSAPVLLVTGASQGARTINDAMACVWPAFHAAHPEWQLLHIAGPADEHSIREAYAAAGVPACVLAFTSEMWLALAAADVVISRAGASTLAELSTLGRPSILLPYPYHRDRHQHANAEVLVAAGAAVRLEDRIAPERNAGPLRAALERFCEPATREAMGRAAAGLARPDAAGRVAEWLLG